MAWRFLGGSNAAPAALATTETEATKRIFDELQELARNLVTIEVNTILKENMVAGPMPSVANSLVEIASSYLAAFERMRLDVSAVDSIVARAEPHSPGDVTIIRHPADRRGATFYNLPEGKGREICFCTLFTRLRWAARLSRQAHAHELDEDDKTILRRIEDNSDKLRVLLQENILGKQEIDLSVLRTGTDLLVANPPLTIEQRLTIKKIWEIGTERVIVQTVVQLDGDIVTRVARYLPKQKDGDGEVDLRQVLEIHQQGISTAMSRWDALVRGAFAVIQGLSRTLMGGGVSR